LQYHNPHQRAPKVVGAAAEAKAALPSREELIAFIGGAPAPDGERAPARVTKRDIARAFGVKGEAKAELKLLIKDLQAEGAIARGRKSLEVEGRLPTLVVADIAEFDRNGELIAKPAEWSKDSPPPRILVRRSRGKRDSAPAPGLGARVLMRVEFDSGAGPTAPAYSGRVIKILDKIKARSFAVYRVAADGSGRALPVEKRASGREYFIPTGMAGEARDGDLVAVEPLREGRFGPPSARVVETIGSVKSERAVSLIALATHHIPHVFSPAALKEAEAARPFGSAPRAKTGASFRSSRSIPPTPRTTTMRFMPPPIPTRRTGAGSLSRSRSRTSRPMSAPARRLIERRWSGGTRSISPTGSCRCCRNAFPTTSARCAR